MLAALANARGLATGVAALRPQDVFATSLYTGNGGTQSIAPGFQPDLFWGRRRNVADDHVLVDAVRGRSSVLYSDLTAAQATSAAGSDLVSFDTNGFTVGPSNQAVLNQSGAATVAWTFKWKAKFFDIVTYTGNGTSGRVIPHALGIKPGMIIVKARDSAVGWPVYHASLGASLALFLNSTSAQSSSGGVTNFGTEPTATGFSVASGGQSNVAGVNYVAYLFAHDPDTTNGIVQCGSFTTNASAGATVNLGWQPQFLLMKKANNTSQWIMVDSARGFVSGNDAALYANLSNAEVSVNWAEPTSTGFIIPDGTFAANDNIVFLAIRAPI